jgi:hypothetical protein
LGSAALIYEKCDCYDDYENSDNNNMYRRGVDPLLTFSPEINVAEP